MGDIVLGVAAAHAPGLTGWMDKAEPETREAVESAYHLLGQEIAAAELDALVIIGNDHLANYNPDHYPDFVVGVGERQVGPAPWFKPWLNVEDYDMPGSPALAEQIWTGLQGFDGMLVERNGRLNFDDNISVPVTMTGFRDMGIALVPLLQNCTVPPVPDQDRCYAFGQRLGEVLRSATPDGMRIGLFGSGGMSHEPGGPRYFDIDENFDRWFLDLLSNGDHEKVLGEATYDRMEEVGAGGTAELLSWMVVMGAIGERRCEVLCYACVPEWRCGVGAVRWDMESQ